MSFDVAAASYDEFMGRYSRLLSPQMVELAGIEPGDRVLDVGCGTGSLVTELVNLLGAAAVAGVDPSETFVDAARQRHPDVRIELATAEALPFEEHSFDATLAQLVVHFMTDPVAGIGEMRRVTRPGGTVAVSVWDFAGGHAPLSLFWDVARELDPTAVDESKLAGVREGHLVELCDAAGLRNVTETSLEISLGHAGFDEWWEPYTGGVGPAGSYLKSLPVDSQEALRRRCHAALPEGPFAVTARAWAVRGTS